MQPRERFLTADEIVSRSNPVLVEMQREEEAERADNIHFLLRLLGAVATVGCILFFTFHFFGR